MGIGFGGAVFLVFLALKLAGVIAWSWWWVTAPLWIGTAFTVLLLLVASRVAWLQDRVARNRRNKRWGER